MRRILSIVDAFLLLLLCVEIALSSSSKDNSLTVQGLHTGYCSNRYAQHRCCPERNDNCSVTYHDTVCYCDIFCNRTITDCCPDYVVHCLRGKIQLLTATKNPWPPATKKQRPWTTKTPRSWAAKKQRPPATKKPWSWATKKPWPPATKNPQSPATKRPQPPPATKVHLPPTTNRPPENIKDYCSHDKRIYKVGDRITWNCNNCTCVYSLTSEEFYYKRIQKNWECTQKICLIQPELLNYVNSNAIRHGWKASNYSVFWGLTLEEGVKRRLGTERPSDYITEMSVLKVRPEERFPLEFDARKEWPGLISPVLDQKDCGSSWAFSTAGVASDRLRIHSKGAFKQTLSPQHLISCNTQLGQHGCESGHVDRAWWFIRKVGIVTDDCFPYTSGAGRKADQCPFPTPFPSLKTWSCPNEKTPVKVYQSSLPYKISSNEIDIMKKLRVIGPLQVVIKVNKDFFMYRSGVYQHSLPAEYQKQTNFHSVRLLGWGVDYSTGRPRKYWLCANSWGRDWGEDGYFRILRGSGESSVESYVIGSWMKIGDRALVQPRPWSAVSAFSRGRHRPSHWKIHEDTVK